MFPRLRSWRLLLSIGLLAVLLTAYLPALAQGGVLLRAGSDLSLRLAPAADSAALATVPAGTALTATSISPDRGWVAVQYGGQSGWLALAWLAVESGSLADLAAPGGQAVALAPAAPQISNLAAWTNAGATIAGIGDLCLRAAPSPDSPSAAAIPANVPLAALALSADGQWVQTIYNGLPGWVERAGVWVSVNGERLEDLAGVPPMTAYEFSLSAAEQMLILVNQARASAGLGPLALNARLTAAAQRHADDMAAHQWFDHTGTDGSTPHSRILDAGYPDGWYGENLAQSWAVNAREAFTLWMTSPGHRENIFRAEYRELGFAVAFGPNYTVYYAQEFGG